MNTKDQKAICEMFDRIAPTYDRVNKILSFKQDIRWRAKVVNYLPSDLKISVLDIATGTADLLIAMCSFCTNITKAFGIDISDNMLKVGNKKIASLGFQDRISLKVADACDLPFADASFDVVSNAFGIRNISQIDKALLESARVLKQNGLLIILEFSLPQNYIVRKLYLFYFRNILPLIGGFLSKDAYAYRYLNNSVEAFPQEQAFKQILLKNGFKSVDITSLTFGIATIYCARKI